MLLLKDWQEILEFEANYAASAMMLCGPVFTEDARDTIPCWSSVADLKKKYGKSYPITLRRYVEYGPDLPLAMLVSTAPWEEKPVGQPKRWRHYVPSREFAKLFGAVSIEALLHAVDSNADERAGGPVADFLLPLEDDEGLIHEFHCESFFNRYYILTLFTHTRKITKGGILVP